VPVDATLADPTAEPNTWKATVLDPWVADVSGTIASLESGAGLPNGVKSLLADYSVNPSGTATSQTTATQAALDDHATWGTLIVDDLFDLNAEISLPASFGKRVIGVGREWSGFNQTGSNVAVFRINGSTHGLVIQDMQIGYQTAQSSANTSAVCLRYVGASGESWYWSRLSNVRLLRGYKGFAATAATNASPWGNQFDSVQIEGITGVAIDWQAPVAAGLPISTWTNTQIFNQGYTSTDVAIRTVAGELLFNGLDIEDWNNQIFEITGGGSGIHVNHLHLERIAWTSSSARIAYVGVNSALRVVGGNLQGTTNPGGATPVYLFNADTGARMVLEDCLYNITKTSGAVQFVRGTTTSNIYLRNNYQQGGDAIDYPNPAGDTNTTTAIKQNI
jgi:hypothetical protein